MEVRYWAGSDVGRQRTINEDSYLADSTLRLFVVADGMGGHAAGEIASATAVRETHQVVHRNRDLLLKYSASDGSVSREQILTLLEHAVQSACSQIYERAQAEPEKRGMGTTTSVLLLAGDRGFIAHVGDSRLYLLRQGKLHQLTEDHSLVNELVKRGKLKREEIDGSPYQAYKTAVTRAVGVYESVQVDTFDLDVLPGDRLLLCSDGLYGHFDDDQELSRLIAEHKPDGPHGFVEEANSRGGRDNITWLLVELLPTVEKPEEQAERIEEVTLKIEVLQRMPLFHHLTYKEVVRLLNSTQVRDYDAGELVCKEGTTGEALFVILRGRVRLCKGDAFITHLGHGAHFGEMALVDRGPRSASVLAEERSRLLLMPRQAFYDVLREEAPLGVKLLWSLAQVLAERLRKTTADLSDARLEAQAIDLSEEAAVEDTDGAG